MCVCVCRIGMQKKTMIIIIFNEFNLTSSSFPSFSSSWIQEEEEEKEDDDDDNVRHELMMMIMMNL